MTRAHIYELGVAFALLAVKKFEGGGEGLLEGKNKSQIGQMIQGISLSIGRPTHSKISDEEITLLLKTYTPAQAVCIINMMGSNDQYRPRMGQIEKAFPMTLISPPAK